MPISKNDIQIGVICTLSSYERLDHRYESRNTYKPIVLNICDESEKSGKPKSFEQKKN